MQTAKELYEQGLTTLETQFSLSAPHWARLAGWDGVGLWVMVTPTALTSAIPGLRVKTNRATCLALLIKRCVQNYDGRKAFFGYIEQQLLNVVIVRDRCFCKLAFDGGTLEMGSAGRAYIAGRFRVKFEYGDEVREVKVKGRLVLQGFRTEMTMAGGDDWVPPFEVTAQLTMSAAELAATDDDDDPHMEALPDTAQLSKRPSATFKPLGRIFSHKRG